MNYRHPFRRRPWATLQITASTCLTLLAAAPVLDAQTAVAGPFIHPPQELRPLVKDIRPGTLGSNPQEMLGLGDLLLFAAHDGVHGNELWCTDGTEGGTRMLADLAPGSSSSHPKYLTRFQGKVYFRASSNQYGSELYVSDGTAAGTGLLIDLAPGTLPSNPSDLAVVGDRIYFSAQIPDPVTGVWTGQELWVSDGSAAGTRMVADIAPGLAASYPRFFAGYPGQVVFQADDGTHGTELWITDGSAAGTRMLADLYDRSPGSRPTFCTAYEGRVYFSAYEQDHGRELWRTDFTTEGTERVLELVVGVGSSDPQELRIWDGLLLFSAQTTSIGRELFTHNGEIGFVRNLVDLHAGSAYPRYLTLVGSRTIYASGNSPVGSGGVGLFRVRPGIPFAHVLPTHESVSSNARGTDLDVFAQRHQRFGVLGSKVFFSATHPDYGRELFVTDNGATSAVVDQGCSGTTLHASDAVIGDFCYLRVETGVEDPQMVTFRSPPVATPLSLPWLSSCPLYLNPALLQPLTVLSAASVPVPGDLDLIGVELVFQSLVFSGPNAVGTPATELSNPVELILGL